MERLPLAQGYPQGPRCPPQCHLTPLSPGLDSNGEQESKPLCSLGWCGRLPRGERGTRDRAGLGGHAPPPAGHQWRDGGTGRHGRWVFIPSTVPTSWLSLKVSSRTLPGPRHTLLNNGIHARLSPFIKSCRLLKSWHESHTESCVVHAGQPRPVCGPRHRTTSCVGLSVISLSTERLLSSAFLGSFNPLGLIPRNDFYRTVITHNNERALSAHILETVS